MSRDAIEEHGDMRVAIRADDRSRKILDRELPRKSSASLDIFNSAVFVISDLLARFGSRTHSDLLARFGES